jgi:cation:H+ antiporter
MSFDLDLPPFLLIGAGLALLAGGGDLLVRGASRLATFYGMSPLVVGLTVVAFGTSAPELAVSMQAVRADAGDLAIGNVLGSNIFNVLFILGLSALVTPLVVSRRVIWIEVPIVIAISMLALILAADGRVGVGDGAILLLVLGGYLLWLRWTADSVAAADAEPSPAGPASSALVAVIGLGLLLLGARSLVGGAASLARSLGVDDAVIGLTIVAAGTSLPEVAASVAALLRGHRDIAVGNVLGSSIFNLTAILGTVAVYAGGIVVAPGLLGFDFIVAVAVAAACLPILYTGHRISRWEGAVFLGYYVAYVAYLVLDATAHASLPHVRDAFTLFVMPLTVVTLAVLVGRARRRQGRTPAA